MSCNRWIGFMSSGFNTRPLIIFGFESRRSKFPSWFCRFFSPVASCRSIPLDLAITRCISRCSLCCFQIQYAGFEIPSSIFVTICLFATGQHREISRHKMYNRECRKEKSNQAPLSHAIYSEEQDNGTSLYQSLAIQNPQHLTLCKYFCCHHFKDGLSSFSFRQYRHDTWPRRNICVKIVVWSSPFHVTNHCLFEVVSQKLPQRLLILLSHWIAVHLSAVDSKDIRQETDNSIIILWVGSA